MSMFRSPTDISSSEPESDCEQSDQSDNDAHSSPSQNELRHASRRASEISSKDRASDKTSTVDSSSGMDSSISFDGLSVAQDALDINPGHHGNMMTAALLEFYCTTRAADILNAQPGTTKRFTRQSPEAQYLGKKLYKYKSQFLSSHGVLADGIDKEELGATRQSYRDNLDLLGRAALESLNLNEPQARTPLEEGEQFALISRKNSGINIQENQFWHGQNKPLPSASNADILGGMPTEANTFTQPSRSLFGSSPVSMPLFNKPTTPSYNHMSRYSVEFQEVKVLGRGSFGQVYHVKNHIDGQDYAVKKIPLSQKRLDQLQYGGQNQLEAIMKEIRTLARLEHTNVVRYYGAWVEQAHVDLSNYHLEDFQKDFQRESSKPFEHQHATHEHSQVHFSSPGSPNEPSMGIIFEHSENTAAETQTSSLRSEHGFPDKISRWSSQATSSSRHSKKSSVTGLEEEDVESIPRSFNAHGQTSTFGETDDIFTDGLSQDHSRLQVQQRVRASQQAPPAVILHIQMSLHPISLNSYLNPQASSGDITPSPARRHCFHLMPSLKLMLDIVSGVEYLHSKDIVHRDLKPANIFLSTPEKVDNDTCISCIARSDPLTRFCRPRIGDFGLVADISHFNEAAAEGAVTPYHGGPKIQRVVGTEFYRPPANNVATGYFDEYKIDEKLDVYALGVILFELVYRLNTKMERQMVLNELTRGSVHLPNDFVTKIDLGEAKLDTGETVAESLSTCIRGMLNAQSQQRWSCQKVKEHLRRTHKAVKRLLARKS